MDSNPLAKSFDTQVPPPSGVQHLFFLDDFLVPTLCDECGELIFGLTRQGYSCSVCKYAIHRRCLQSASKSCRVESPTARHAGDSSRGAKKIGDKASKLANKVRFEHNWAVDGTIPMTSICYMCHSPIFFFDGKECTRCERIVHTECLLTAKECRPRHKHLIYVEALDKPSTSLTPEEQSNRAAATSTETAAEWEIVSYKRMPLLVIINARSGGQYGNLLVSRLSNLLSPEQVFMLDETGPKPILDKFRGVKNLRILACGGDGTVGWVMNCLDELKFDPHPPVAVLPLGTGNDLARTLKWGAGYAGESLSNILNRVEMAQTINLDRWHVAVTPFAEDGTPITSKRTETIMNNYVSVGVDAHVALNFHSMRKENPDLFLSQWMNRLWYGAYGFFAMFAGLEDLGKIVRMTVDGVSVDIPDNTEGLIFLNISHWGGGSDLWGVTFESDADPLLEAKRFLNPRIDDKMLEVAAVSSSFHLATITALPLNHATRLCQGAHIELVIEPENDMPIQVDGEPTTVKGCRVVISHHGQAVLLQDVM